MEWEKLEKWIHDNSIGKCRALAPLADYTSWKIGGPARLMAWPEDEEKCTALLCFCAWEAYPIRFLGAGTNLLAADAGVEALVIHTGEFNRLEWAETLSPVDSGSGTAMLLVAGAGLPLARLAKEAAKSDYQGLEFAVGIPGSFGGALVMNAGAYGGQISDLVEYVRVMDAYGRIRILDREEAGFRYRSSGLKGTDQLVLGGGLRLIPGDSGTIQTLMKGYLDSRREKQPLDLPSGGSVFRNPAGGGAGRFIDQAGLKGLRIGDAQISERHANFIVNLGRAKAGDVIALMERAKDEVKERFGVTLESEIVYWS